MYEKWKGKRLKFLEDLILGRLWLCWEASYEGRHENFQKHRKFFRFLSVLSLREQIFFSKKQSEIFNKRWCWLYQVFSPSSRVNRIWSLKVKPRWNFITCSWTYETSLVIIISDRVISVFGLVFFLPWSHWKESELNTKWMWCV